MIQKYTRIFSCICWFTGQHGMVIDAEAGKPAFRVHTYIRREDTYAVKTGVMNLRK